MVPILMTILPQLSIQQVAATSLSIVIGTALINLTYFLRQKITISFKSLVVWSIGMIVGVQAGFELSFIVHKYVIIGVFVVAMLILSIKTFLLFFKHRTLQRQSAAGQNASGQSAAGQSAAGQSALAALSTVAKEQTSSTSTPTKAVTPALSKDKWLGGIFCTLGGMVAGLTGVGGGSILAPIISQLNSVEHKQVAVYTNYMMVIGGLGSMYSYLTKETPNLFAGTWQIGYINFSLIGIVLVASLCTSFFSMRLRHILKAHVANLLLACLLCFIAFYTLWIGALN